MSSVFAALNQGESVTKGLKKVDTREMTHKNPELRASGAVPAAGASPSPFLSVRAREGERRGGESADEARARARSGGQGPGQGAQAGGDAEEARQDRARRQQMEYRASSLPHLGARSSCALEPR